MTDNGTPQQHPDCLACQILAGTQTVPGGTIAENPWWVADHCVGPYGLGSVVIKTRTHRENLWELTAAESAAMGPFLQQMSEAIALGMGAERVYIGLWVDQPPYHVHFVLQPRYPDGHHPEELGLKGLELQVFRTLGKPPSQTDMAKATEQIRAVWQQKFAPQTSAKCES